MALKAPKLIKHNYLILIFLFSIVIFNACDSNKLSPTSIEDFVGNWELEGRSMFDGINIKIDTNNKGNLEGRVTQLNDNKYVSMFVEESDIWVSKISRSSNFEFQITEKKIGSALFSLYGLETTQEFRAQFIDKNTIGLSVENSKPTDSSIRYVRKE